MSGKKSGMRRKAASVPFYDLYNIQRQLFQLQVVQVDRVSNKDRREYYANALYQSLKKEEYRWDILFLGKYTGQDVLAEKKIVIENIRVTFPKADELEYLLIPSDAKWIYGGRQIFNFHQEQPVNAIDGDLAFEFRQHLHLFSIVKPDAVEKPDEQFWQAIRNFLGYRRIYDSRYKEMRILMKIDICSRTGVIGTFYWHSRWDAVKSFKEACAFNRADSDKKRLIYEPVSHWINGETDE